jgi:hypothetical protein
MRKEAKNHGKTMLPPALSNSKPHGDVSDLERSEAIIIPSIHYFATAYNPCCFHPTRSKSNASAFARGANDLAFLSSVTDETFPPHLAHSRMLAFSSLFHLDFFLPFRLLFD